MESFASRLRDRILCFTGVLCLAAGLARADIGAPHALTGSSDFASEVPMPPDSTDFDQFVDGTANSCSMAPVGSFSTYRGMPMDAFRTRLAARACDSILAGSSNPNAASDAWPGCSSILSAMLEAKNPNAGAAAISQLLSQEIGKQDVCKEGSAENRFSGAFVPPTQAAAKLHPMSPSEQTDLMFRLMDLRTRVVQSCCADGDADCSKYMNQVKIVFCQIKPTPTEPDPCISTGANYALTNPERQAIHEHFTRVRSYLPQLTSGPDSDFSNFSYLNKGLYPISPGRIMLPPLLDASGYDYINEDTLLHEFSHACSSVRRQIAMSRGDKDATANFVNGFYSGAQCAVTDQVKRDYISLYSKTGADPATAVCIITSSVATAPFERFDSTKPCPNGCPKSFIEEAYAQWGSVSELRDDQFIPYVVPRICLDARDSLHPFGPDEFRCMLKTPAFAARARRLMGCQ